MDPSTTQLQLLQMIARGTFRAASCVSSATCAATSYPASVQAGERNVKQNAHAVGQPVWLYTWVKMSFAELMFGEALIGRRIVVMMRTMVPRPDAKILNQETYLVGRQMMRYDININTRYTSCLVVSETAELASRVESGTHVYVPTSRLIVWVDKLDGRNEELGRLRKGSGACYPYQWWD